MCSRLSVFFLVILSGSLKAQKVQQIAKTNSIKTLSTRSLPVSKEVKAGFVNDNIRYTQGDSPAPVVSTEKSLSAWKGEKVHTQLAIWAPTNIQSISIKMDALRSANGNMIRKSNIITGFVKYVMTDEFGNGCGRRKPQDFDSSLVADPIDTSIRSIALGKNNIQPLWVTVNVPSNVAPGQYKGIIQVNADETRFEFPLTVNVLNRTLPPPSEWKFNLDLWQHHAAIARVHKVALWSDAHFALMKKYYTALAKAGQKNITASIVNEPWGHQTYDDFPSLIKWIKKKDGTWQYDYDLFDKYISFVMSCGIRQRINCYSMVPWKIAFQYYDERSGKDTVFTGKIGSTSYNEFWKPMLTDFTRHLRKKGWFEITAIAMDERPMEAMQSVIRLLKEVDKDWKVALAGNYHPEIENDVFDYCIASRWQFPADTLLLRQQQGKISTWYTCCTENYPNGFTFSPPAEHVWLGWYTAAKNMDGYLRWAFNSWPANPMQDSRYITWPAGDTYQVYPGPLTSIRFEKLIEGIQDFEKIQILRKEYTNKGDKKRLQELEEALKEFNIGSLQHHSAEEMVMNSKALLNH